MAEEKKSRTPEEQEQAFKSWLQKKTLKDTTFAYLERLDPVHAVEEENLKQVAVALRAAQQVLGDDDENTGGDDYGDPEDVSAAHLLLSYFDVYLPSVKVKSPNTNLILLATFVHIPKPARGWAIVNDCRKRRFLQAKISPNRRR